MSGYVPCACRDCFEIAIASDVTKPTLCCECQAEGCDVSGQSACEVECLCEEEMS